MAAQPIPLRKWKYPQTDATLEKIKEAMLEGLAAVDNKYTTRSELQCISDEWLYAKAPSAWPLWQALAANKHTPELVLRQLWEKKLWYLDILIVQHSDVPRDILEATVELPKEILAAHGTYKGYDKNKELRAHARNRLGLPPEEDEDKKD